MRIKNRQLNNDTASSAFYHLCGNDGALRPEAFSADVDPSAFHYVFADRMTYRLSETGITLSGELDITIKEGEPLWLLLHMNGTSGEMACWINMEQTDRRRCHIHKTCGERSENCKYRITASDLNVSLYAFILRAYVKNAWARWIEEVSVGRHP